MKLNIGHHKVSNTFHFPLSNVTNEIVDTSTLVGQPGNEQNPFILESVIQQTAPSLEHLVISHTNTDMVTHSAGQAHESVPQDDSTSFKSKDA